MKRISKFKPKKDFYSDYGRKSEREHSFASFDDMFVSDPNAEKFDEISMDFDAQDSHNELDDLVQGLEGSDIASMTSMSVQSSNDGRLRSLSDTSSMSGVSDFTDEDGLSVKSNQSSQSGRSGKSSRSEASFEDVFSKYRRKNTKKDEKFSFTNPGSRGSGGRKSWSNKAVTSQAVLNVLSKPGTTVDKARRLFVLEQLQQPAPPEKPPSLWAHPGAIGKPIRERKGLNRKQRLPTYEVGDLVGISNRINEEGAKIWPTFTTMLAQDAKDKSNKRFKGVKNVRKLEEKRAALKETFVWKIGSLVTDSSKLKSSWLTRVRVARGVAALVKNLHSNNHLCGDLVSENVVLDHDLVISIIDGGNALDLDSQHFKVAHRGVQADDLMNFESLKFGIFLFQLITQSDSLTPLLVKLVKTEEETVFLSEDDRNKNEKLQLLENGAEKLEQELRKHLESYSSCPSSLIELCVQSCDGIRGNRPDIVDAWEWLQSILEDAEKEESTEKTKNGKSRKGKKNAIPFDESPNQLLESLLKLKKNGHLESPKLVQVDQVVQTKSYGNSEDDEMDEGYETDDSFQPPAAEERSAMEIEEAANRTIEKRGSRLLDFLSTTVESTVEEVSEDVKKVPPPVPPRPKSEKFDTNGHLANTFLGFSDVPGAVGVGKPIIQRRRSLDRGYLYAKSHFSTPTVPVATANVKQFKQAWIGKQSRVNATKIPDPEQLAKRLEKQELISTDEALALVKKATKVLTKESNLLRLKAPVNVVGDIHGQFFDLRNMMQIGGAVGKKKSQTQYLFLGDYVDRGEFSCEVLLYLFSLKVKHKDCFWLLRGNHECRSVASYFGFKDECEMKYGTQVFNACMEAFQAMPIAAVVDSAAGRFLCLHGGISPNVTSLDQFVEFDRFSEPGMNGFLCDLLWSDPVKDDHEDGHDQSLGDFLSIDYLPNPARGCSYRYGFRALVTFLATNRLVALIRAHEVQEEGYRYHFQELSGKKGTTAAQVTPPVITVFSAPNYCGRYGNKAAYIRIHEKVPGRLRARLKSGTGIRPMQLLEPVQFIAVPHPLAFNFENAAQQEVTRIEGACPYMPSTFYSFIKRAIELLEQDPEEFQAARLAAKEATQKKKEEESKKVVALQPKKQKSKNWKAAAILGLGEGMDEPSIRPSGKNNSKKHKEYEDAAAVDGVNEMNPQLLQQKMEKAKLKVKKSGGIKLSGMKHDKKLAKTKSVESMDGGASPMEESIEKDLDDQVEFTDKELLSLQTLFLLIDHKDDGSIDADDLVAWSEEDGTAVLKSEAEMCVQAVDADGDGMIGFEDYLAFAARCKEQWVLQQYNSVVDDIKAMQHRQ